MAVDMIVTQWQTIVAVAIAAGCGVWVVWRLLRPFIARSVDACGGESDDSGLIQIEAAETDTSAGCAVKAEPHSG
jgi:hypothetical protein